MYKISLLNILMIFAIKDHLKKDYFDPYNVFFAIAINIPQWLKTGFVVQCHICPCFTPSWIAYAESARETVSLYFQLVVLVLSKRLYHIHVKWFDWFFT